MATFYNQATLSYSGGTVYSNTTVGEVLNAITATKTAVLPEYSANSEVTYSINLINTGSVAYSDLTVTDDLGGYDFGGNTLVPLDYIESSARLFINGVLQPAPAVVAGDVLTFSGIDIPAFANANILYSVRVNEVAPLAEGSVITNTASVTGNCVSALSAVETITVSSAPELTIAKSLEPATVSSCGSITYTFVISNFGNAAASATDNVVVTDQFNPILTDLVVSYNGTPWTAGVNYTYNEATGEFGTALGEIVIPAATFEQDAVTGEVTVIPSTVTLTVSGNL